MKLVAFSPLSPTYVYLLAHYNSAVATMKFSLTVFTAGLFLATAAALPSSHLNLPLMKFSTLDDNILSKTEECAEPDKSKGIATSLTLTNCTQATYPCHCKQGGTYTLTTTFTCGQNRASLQGMLTAKDSLTTILIFIQPPDTAVQCIVGNLVSASFTFTVRQTTLATTYDIVFRVVDGNSAASGDNEVCRKGKFVVDLAIGIGK